MVGTILSKLIEYLLLTVLVKAMDLVSVSIMKLLKPVNDNGTALSLFNEYFHFNTSDGNTISIYKIIMIMALALTLLIFIFELVKNFGIGRICDAEHPVTLVGKMIISAFCVINATQIFKIILKIVNIPYGWGLSTELTFSWSDLGEKMLKNLENTIGNVAVAAIVPNLIILIMLIILAWNYLKLLMSAVERYVIVGVLYYTSPLAFSALASKNTVSIFKSWARMIANNALMLVFNVFFIRLSTGALLKYIESFGGTSNLFLGFFLLTAFMRIGTSFDRYLQTVGLGTPQSGTGIMSDILIASRLVSGLGRAAGSGHGGVFSGGGGGGGIKGFVNNVANNMNNPGGLKGFAEGMKKDMSAAYGKDAAMARAAGATDIGRVPSSFAGKMFEGHSNDLVKRGVPLSANSIGAVVNNGNTRSSISGASLDKGIKSNFFPEFANTGYQFNNSVGRSGQISADITTPSGKTAHAEMLSANMHNAPVGPYRTITDADGNKWFLIASGEGASELYNEGLSFNGTESKEALQGVFGENTDIASVQSNVDENGMPDGTFSVTHDDGSTSTMYNAADYDESEFENVPHSTVIGEDGSQFYDVPDVSNTDFDSAVDLSEFGGETPFSTSELMSEDEIGSYVSGNLCPELENNGYVFSDGEIGEDGVISGNMYNAETNEASPVTFTPAEEGAEVPDGSFAVTDNFGNTYFASVAGNEQEAVTAAMTSGFEGVTVADENGVLNFPSSAVDETVSSVIAPELSEQGYTFSDSIMNEDGSISTIATDAEGNSFGMTFTPVGTDEMSDITDRFGNGYSIDTTEINAGGIDAVNEGDISSLTAGYESAGYEFSNPIMNEDGSITAIATGPNSEAYSVKFDPNGVEGNNLAVGSFNDTKYDLDSIDQVTDGANNIVANDVASSYSDMGYSFSNSSINEDGSISTIATSPSGEMSSMTFTPTGDNGIADIHDSFGNGYSVSSTAIGDSSELNNAVANEIAPGYANAGYSFSNSVMKDDGSISTVATSPSGESFNMSFSPESSAAVSATSGTYNGTEFSFGSMNEITGQANNIVANDVASSYSDMGYSFSNSSINEDGSISTIATSPSGEMSSMTFTPTGDNGIADIHDSFGNGYSVSSTAIGDSSELNNAVANEIAPGYANAGYSFSNSVMNDNGSISTVATSPSGENFNMSFSPNSINANEMSISSYDGKEYALGSSSRISSSADNMVAKSIAPSYANEGYTFSNSSFNSDGSISTVATSSSGEVSRMTFTPTGTSSHSDIVDSSGYGYNVSKTNVGNSDTLNNTVANNIAPSYANAGYSFNNTVHNSDGSYSTTATAPSGESFNMTFSPNSVNASSGTYNGINYSPASFSRIPNGFDETISKVIAPELSTEGYKFSNSTVDSNGSISTIATSANGNSVNMTFTPVGSASNADIRDSYGNGYAISFSGSHSGTTSTIDSVNSYMNDKGYIPLSNPEVHSDNSISRSYITDNGTVSVRTGINEDGNHFVKFSGTNSDKIESDYSNSNYGSSISNSTESSIRSTIGSNYYDKDMQRMSNDITGYMSNQGYYPIGESSLNMNSTRTAEFENANGNRVSVNYGNGSADSFNGEATTSYSANGRNYGVSFDGDNSDALNNGYRTHINSSSYSGSSAVDSYMSEKGYTTMPSGTSYNSDGSVTKSYVSNRGSVNVISMTDSSGSSSVKFEGRGSEKLQNEFYNSSYSSSYSGSASREARSIIGNYRDSKEISRISDNVSGYMSSQGYSPVGTHSGREIYQNASGEKVSVSVSQGSSSSTLDSGSNNSFSSHGRDYSVSFMGNNADRLSNGYTGYRNSTSMPTSDTRSYTEQNIQRGSIMSNESASIASKMNATQSMIYNKQAVSSFVPSYAENLSRTGRDVISVDATSARQGMFEIRTKDSGNKVYGTRFYDSSVYRQPSGQYNTYSDAYGKKWYSIEGQARVDRRPIFDSKGNPRIDKNGEPIQSSKTVISYRTEPQKLNSIKRKDTHMRGNSVFLNRNKNRK